MSTAIILAIAVAAIGGYLYGRADRRHACEQQLQDQQYQIVQLLNLLDKTQEAIAAKDHIICDLVAHGDALVREIDARDAARRGAA